MMSKDATIYRNTPERAKQVGWPKVEEYCFGDPKAQFVAHDHKAGKFYFTNDGVCRPCMEHMHRLCTGGDCQCEKRDAEQVRFQSEYQGEVRKNDGNGRDHR